MAPHLPNEIIEQIIESMAADKSTSLVHVAQVNSVTCHVVRTARFESLTLKGEYHTMRFLAILVAQMMQQQNGSTRPTIGSYIRHLTLHYYHTRVPPQGDFVWWLGKISEAIVESPSTLILDQGGHCIRSIGATLLSPSLQLGEGSTRRRVVSANLLTAMKHAMPRLKTLRWLGSLLYRPKATLENMWLRRSDCFSHVDTLELHCYWQKFMGTGAMLDTCPVTSLSLCIETIYNEADEIEKFDKAMVRTLKACAATIKDLTLDLRTETSLIPLFNTAGPWEHVEFPALQKLTIRHLDVARGLLRALVRSKVQDLSIYSGFDASGHIFLLQHRIARMPQLQRISMPLRIEMEWIPDVVQFLTDHVHIKDLRLERVWSQGLDEHIVPTIAGPMFSSLTYLSLLWFQPHDLQQPAAPRTIKPASIAAIGLIHTLKHLRLATDRMAHGRRPFCECIWEVDHDGMRRWLSGLKNLKLLCLEHEIRGWGNWAAEMHQSNGELLPLPSDIHQYAPRDRMFGWEQDMIDLRARPELDLWRFYEDGFQLPPDQLNTVWKPGHNAAREATRRWVSILDRYCWLRDADNDSYEVFYTILQRNRALDEAERYAHAFPSLKVIYLGETSMRIQVPGSGRHGNAVPMDMSPRSFPSNVFGMEDALDRWVEDVTMNPPWAIRSRS